MTHLDLFSGIGGFALAARWSGLETTAFCENDPYCERVLRKNFPGVPIHDDIQTLDGTQFKDIYLITGGFPCQDISIAGKGAGIDGQRSGLWTELHRMNGKLWEQTTWGHHTGGRESGLWPTPRAQDAKHGAATEWELNTDHAGTRDSLRVQVEHRKLGPTPTSRDHKDTGDSVRDGTVPVNGLLGRSVEGSKAGGSLNPDWVEHYLMGYPLGWTSLTSPELPKESRIVSTDSGPSETPLSQESPMKSSNP